MIARRRRPPRGRGRPNGEGIAGWTVAPHPPRRCTPGFTRRTAATTRLAPAAAATPAPPRHGTARNAPTPAGDGARCAGRSNSGCRSRSGSPSAITAASTAASAAGSGPWRHGHRSPVMLEVYARAPTGWRRRHPPRPRRCSPTGAPSPRTGPARRSAHRDRVPGRLPGRPENALRLGRRDRPPAHRGRASAWAIAAAFGPRGGHHRPARPIDPGRSSKHPVRSRAAPRNGQP